MFACKEEFIRGMSAKQDFHTHWLFMFESVLAFGYCWENLNLSRHALSYKYVVERSICSSILENAQECKWCCSRFWLLTELILAEASTLLKICASLQARLHICWLLVWPVVGFLNLLLSCPTQRPYRNHDSLLQHTSIRVSRHNFIFPEGWLSSINFQARIFSSADWLLHHHAIFIWYWSICCTGCFKHERKCLMMAFMLIWWAELTSFVALTL